MFKWRKLGQLFDPKTYPMQTWMHEFAQSPSTLILKDRVRVVFCSRPRPDPEGMYVSYLASLDLDRNDPTRILEISDAPLMQLGERGCFDEFGTNPVSVIADGPRIRAYYAGWTRCESVPINGCIGLAISEDLGRTFRRLGPGPILSYSVDEPFLLGSPRIRRFNERWVLFYVSGKRWIAMDGARPEPVYKIRAATSDNGLDWTKLGHDLIEDRLGPNECQACPDVAWHNDCYHMFFSYRDSHHYKVGTGGYRIGYAWSTDMLAWHRADHMAGIGVSSSGWDSQMASYPHVFLLDGKWFMLYQGNEMGRAGIGIAQLDQLDLTCPQ